MSSLKLEFLTEAMEYLRPVLRETKTVEETAEAIIPDSCPDVTEILFGNGMAFLRGKDISDGTAAVSAGVSASALVQPDGRQEPELVEVYIPMSLRLENSLLKSGMLNSAKVELRRLDSHMVNPRKILVRATVAVTLCVWEQCREEHVTGPVNGGAELLSKVEPMHLLTNLGEKNYTVEDTVRLSPEGLGKTLVSCCAKITHTDSRLTGTRAVFKGEIALDVLYLDEAGKPAAGSGTMPFSQYIDLGECSEEDELRLETCLTGADVEFAADGGGLNVTLQLLSKAQVWAHRELSYLADLYTLKGQAEPVREKRSYESLLDRQYFSPTARGTVPGIGGQVAKCVCVPGELTHTKAGENTEFTIPVSVQVLSDGEGRLLGGSTKVNLTFRTQAAPGCRFEVQAEELTASANSAGGSVDVQVSGTISVSTYGSAEISEVVGCEVGEAEPVRDRPGLVIRRPAPGETLWDIARQYRSTMAAIAAANGLEGEPTPDMLLLIPGRGA